MARPKGTLSTRRRLLTLATRSEGLLEKIDAALAADPNNIALLKERTRLAVTIVRALSRAELVKTTRSEKRRHGF